MALKAKNYNLALKLGAVLDDVKISDLGDLVDANGNELLEGDTVASAVNNFRIANSATGTNPLLSAVGDDTNVGVDVTSKGTGSVTLWAGAKTRELLILSNTASAVNELTVAPAATGSGPTLSATGDDTNIDVTLKGKGTGSVILGQATSTGVQLAADQPINDSSSNEYLKFTKTASAVNEFTVTNAATNTNPTISATGGDTNIGINLTPKGTGVAYSTAVGGLNGVNPKLTVTTDTTANAVTYTAAVLKGGLILRDPNGAGRTDVLPTAALLVAAFPGCPVGTSFMFVIRNTADAAETITVQAGSGGTVSGTATIAQNNSKLWLVRLDNVTASSEAYTAYSVGTFVH